MIDSFLRCSHWNFCKCQGVDLIRNTMTITADSKTNESWVKLVHCHRKDWHQGYVSNADCLASLHDFFFNTLLFSELKLALYQGVVDQILYYLCARLIALNMEAVIPKKKQKKNHRKSPLRSECCQMNVPQRTWTVSRLPQRERRWLILTVPTSSNIKTTVKSIMEDLNGAHNLLHKWV